MRVDPRPHLTAHIPRFLSLLTARCLSTKSLKSRDDIPKFLRGLQGIYTNEELRPERKKGDGKADPNTGRTGMVQQKPSTLDAISHAPCGS